MIVTTPFGAILMKALGVSTGGGGGALRQDIGDRGDRIEVRGDHQAAAGEGGDAEERTSADQCRHGVLYSSCPPPWRVAAGEEVVRRVPPSAAAR